MSTILDPRRTARVAQLAIRHTAAWLDYQLGGSGAPVGRPACLYYYGCTAWRHNDVYQDACVPVRPHRAAAAGRSSR